MQPKGGALASHLSTLSTLSRYGGHIVGVGILGVPFAVSQAGVVASALCIIAICSLSLLTCWWLLEVGDRANAIQNELARSFETRPSCEVVVQHSDGHRSRLQPAIAFGRGAAPPATGLREPLLGGETEAGAHQLDRLRPTSRPASSAALDAGDARRSDGEERLDDYRAAYRSWRQGGHAGARDSELKKLRHLLVYETSMHRKLLPLQLVPPPRRRSGTARPGAGRAAGGGGGPWGCSGGASVTPAEGESGLSLDGVLVMPDSGADISRSGSFSVDLKAALERSCQPSRGPDLGTAGASPPDGEGEAAGAHGGLLEGGHTPPLLDTWTIPRLGELFPDSSPASPTMFRSRRDLPWYSPEQSPRSATPDSACALSPMASARRLLPASIVSPRERTATGAAGGATWSGGGGGGGAGGGLSAGDGSDPALGSGPPGPPIPRVRSLEMSAAVHRGRPALHPLGATVPDWSVPAISSLEVAQLCTLFLGGRARASWIASVCLLHVGAMWACAAIWLQTCHAALGNPPGEPVPPPLVLLCAAVLVPASIVGGSARLQPTISVATAAAAAVMMGFLAAAMAEHGRGSPTWQVFDSPRRTPPPRPVPLRLLVDPSHLPQTSAALAFCHAIQQSVPALRRAPGGAAAARRALRVGLCGCGLVYLLFGCLTALVFGDATLPLVTLHFRSLHCAPPHAPPPVWASAAGGAVALLPMLSTTAAFPLFNGVLAANLAVVLPTRLASRRLTAPLCALPPLLAAAALADTPSLLALCGLPCLVIAFLIPAALQAAALRASLRRWGEAGRRTPHSTPLSGAAPALGLFVLGAAVLAAGIWSLLLQPLLHALGVPGG